MRTALLAGLIALLFPACLANEITGIGGEEEEEEEMGSGSGSGSGATPRIVTSVDKTTVNTELGKTETVIVTITGENGFSGNVTVTPSLLDGTTALTGFDLTATPQSVDLAADGTATVTVQIKVPTDPAVLAPTLKIDLGGASTATVSSSLAITNKLTIDIPAGTGTAAHTGLPAINAPINLRSGAQVVWHNSDNMQHVIHAVSGFTHEDQTNGGMPNGDFMITVTDTARWYCHDHEAGGQTRALNVL